MSLPSRIRTARRLVGYSQARLAEELNVHRSAASHWERGCGRSPTVTHLRQIAEVRKVNFEWLTTGRGTASVSSEVLLDSIAPADALVTYDDLEMRLLQAFRDAPVKSRVALVEVVEQLAAQRVPRRKGLKQAG